MTPYEIAWGVWLLAFAVVETWAVWSKARGRPAQTLTDLVQQFREWRWGSLDVGRFLLACGLLWLVGHFFDVW